MKTVHTIAAPTFTRRQIVEVRSAMGGRVDRAAVIGGHARRPGWYVVRFDDGGCMSVHASNMQAAGDRPFKGALPTYRSTQRREFAPAERQS